MKKSILGTKFKLAALALALLMLLALASCGSGKESSSSASGSGESSQSSSADESGGGEEEAPEELVLPLTDENIELTMWTIWSNDYVASLNDIEAVQQMEKDTGVKVNYIAVAPTAATEKFGMMLASGEYPDMINHLESSVRYPGGGDKAIADGIYVDMTELAAKYMPNYSRLRKFSPEVEQMTLTDEGRMWAIYMFRANTQGELMAEPAWTGMVIRTDWLEDLNLDRPVTVDDWYNVLTAFKTEKGAEAPLMMESTGTIFMDYFLSAYGVTRDFYRDGSTVKFGPSEEGYRKYVETMRKWYDEGLIDPNFISNNSSLVMLPEYGATGKSGAGTNMWGLTQQFYFETGQTEDDRIRFEAIQGPVLNKGEVAQKRFPSYIATNQISLTTSCKYPELAAKWMDYQYTTDALITNYYGVEGVTYDMVDGIPQYTDLILKNPDGLSPSDALGKSIRGDGVGLNAWDRWDLIYDQEKLSAREVWNADGMGLVIPPITMTESEGLEYNNLFTDIQTYVQEKTISYIMGTESMDSYDDFVSQIEKMNIARCIEIQQAALDRFNARAVG